MATTTATLTATFSASIPAPIQKVFELLTDPAHIPQWLPGCKAVEPAGALRKGSKIRVNYGDRISEMEIVELTPPHNFGWLERRGRPGQQTYFNLGFGGGSTKLTMKAIWQPHGWIGWFSGRLRRRRDAKRFFEGVVNNLRSMVTS
jgi:uncharacterized protein YndB with AHSA1/START domain